MHTFSFMIGFNPYKNLFTLRDSVFRWVAYLSNSMNRASYSSIVLVPCLRSWNSFSFLSKYSAKRYFARNFSSNRSYVKVDMEYPNWDSKFLHHNSALSLSWYISNLDFWVARIVPQLKTQVHVFQPSFCYLPFCGTPKDRKLNFFQLFMYISIRWYFFPFFLR